MARLGTMYSLGRFWRGSDSEGETNSKTMRSYLRGQFLRRSRSSFLAIGAICAALPFEVHAQGVVSGKQLEIGSAGSDQVNAAASGAVGTGNRVKSSASLAVGGTNVVETNGVAFGKQNIIDSRGAANTTIGISNQVSAGSANLVTGRSNFIETDGTDSHNPSAVFVSGEGNDLNGSSDSSIVSGNDNWVMNAPFSSTFGQGLNNFWPGASVLGRFNSISLSGDPVLVVGNGSGTNSRSNVFEVFASGTVKLTGKLLLSGSTADVRLNGEPLVTSAAADSRYLTPTVGDARYYRTSNPTLATTGSVGIGTTTPSAPLEIKNGGSSIRMFPSMYGNYNILEFDDGNAGSHGGILTGYAAVGNIRMQNYRAGDVNVLIWDNAAFGFSFGEDYKNSRDVSPMFCDTDKTVNLGQYPLRSVTQPLLLVANGGPQKRSNALTVLRTGEARVSGNLVVNCKQDDTQQEILPDPNEAISVHTRAYKQMSGTLSVQKSFLVSKDGNVTASGTITGAQLSISGTLPVLHVRPGGDVPMFGH